MIFRHPDEHDSETVAVIVEVDEIHNSNRQILENKMARQKEQMASLGWHVDSSAVFDWQDDKATKYRGMLYCSRKL